MPELGLLHAHLIRQIIDTGKLPTAREAAQSLGTSKSNMCQRFGELQDHHGCVLHPHDPEKVWVIHPFSSSPTLFSLHSGNQIWWANCAWCALGAAALIGDCRISTTLGGYDRPVDIVIENGEIRPNDLLIHFPVPMTQAWDNVIYTCSVMLLFANERDVDDWCRRHGVPRGDIRTLAEFWPFSREWYGNHLSPSWQKISLSQARDLFAQYGLDGPIWSLPEDSNHF